MYSNRLVRRVGRSNKTHDDRMGKKCTRVTAQAGRGEKTQRSVSVRIGRVKAEKAVFQPATGAMRRRRRRSGRLGCPAGDACGTATEAVGRSARAFYRDTRRAVWVTFLRSFSLSFGRHACPRGDPSPGFSTINSAEQDVRIVVAALHNGREIVGKTKYKCTCVYRNDDDKKKIHSKNSEINPRRISSNVPEYFPKMIGENLALPSHADS